MTLGLRDLAFLGGGAPAVPWTPAQLGADLRLWLDADDASTISLNGSLVTQWRDKSGLANHMSQTIQSFELSYQANAVNGRAAVVDLGTPGGNFFMETVQNVSMNGSGMTIYGVGRPDTDANSGTARFIMVPNYVWFGTWFLDLSGNLQIGTVSARFGDGSTWTLGSSSNVAWEDTLRVVGSTVNASGSQITYADGTAGPTQQQAFANWNATVQLNHVFGGSQQWRGPMCEVVMSVNVLGTSDRQKLEGYLAHRWQGAGGANNLPSGHPYKAAAPTV